ncbi:DeoR family transcriptional regulator [Streptomyces alboflavus]|uniref:DeoR family transcriptional regulator n=1 Tax=Streptomyces alboflavus TaxID=67267 RepID=A0A1Z1WPV0_9ACTN|nr:DeoR family transcriptional regulator [Streptomyces alboflavus]
MRAADLADDFDVSLMTVHRDLDFLQSQGWLRKVRGGARRRCRRRSSTAASPSA